MSQELIALGCYPVSEFSPMPKYGSEFSACFDLGARLADVTEVTYFNAHNSKLKKVVYHDGDNSRIIIKNGERVLIPCGWIFDIPVGHSLRMHPRSGLSLKKGIILPNCQGIIDADFPNESMIMLSNISEADYIVHHGDEMCQGEVVRDLKSTFVVGAVGQLPPMKQSSRTGGFGHTTPKLVK